jgi:hypothetical protein
VGQAPTIDDETRERARLSVAPDQSDAETARLARARTQSGTQISTSPETSPSLNARLANNTQLKQNLTPEQLKWTGEADLVDNVGVVSRMPLPSKEEMADVTSKLEGNKSYDVAYGDVDSRGKISNVNKLPTAEDWSERTLGVRKKLSDMSVSEIMRFQRERPEGQNAVGAYQFVPATLEALIKKEGISPNQKFDKATQDKLNAALMLENGKSLQRNGIVPDKVNIYMAHRLGAPATISLYKEVKNNPEKSVADLTTELFAKRNKLDPNNPAHAARISKYKTNILKNNPDFNRSINSFYSHLSNKINAIKEKEESQITTENTCPHCGGIALDNEILAEKKDACYHKVKSRYKVWPSAYASGALVKCRKKGAKNWGKSKTNEDTNLYFNVVGTDKKTLISEFKLQHNRRGWYLNENSPSSLKLDAVRAFGMPLSEEELNPIAYDGTAATIGTDNSKSPVGSIPKSQRINKRRGKV